jgi:hypothetical protein
MSRPWQTDGVECMGRKYETAHGRRAGAIAACALEARAWAGEARAEQTLVRELLQQSRELLNWMQGG